MASARFERRLAERRAARAYARDDLLLCLTGSGADAYERLAELIGATDEEIDAARRPMNSNTSAHVTGERGTT